MPTIAGASQYLNAATLANQQGVGAVQPTVLGDSGSTVSLLDSARVNTGIGLSARARAQTEAFLSQTSSSFNTIHSLAISATGDAFALQQSILALRASLPDSAISPTVLGSEEDTAEGTSTGQNVDIEA